MKLIYINENRYVTIWLLRKFKSFKGQFLPQNRRWSATVKVTRNNNYNINAIKKHGPYIYFQINLEVQARMQDKETSDLTHLKVLGNIYRKFVFCLYYY